MGLNKFVTKDSGKRIETKSGMVRDTQDGKPRYDLIIAETHGHDMLTRWAELLERGMSKYRYRNWEKADSLEEFTRFKASVWRHFVQAMKGEEDEDHIAAVFFNLNAITYLMEKLNIDIHGNKRSTN